MSEESVKAAATKLAEAQAAYDAAMEATREAERPASAVRRLPSGEVVANEKELAKLRSKNRG